MFRCLEHRGNLLIPLVSERLFSLGSVMADRPIGNPTASGNLRRADAKLIDAAIKLGIPHPSKCCQQYLFIMPSIHFLCSIKSFIMIALISPHASLKGTSSQAAMCSRRSLSHLMHGPTSCARWDRLLAPPRSHRLDLDATGFILVNSN